MAIKRLVSIPAGWIICDHATQPLPVRLPSVPSSVAVRAPSLFPSPESRRGMEDWGSRRPQFSTERGRGLIGNGASVPALASRPTMISSQRFLAHFERVGILLGDNKGGERCHSTLSHSPCKHARVPRALSLASTRMLRSPISKHHAAGPKGGILQVVAGRVFPRVEMGRNHANHQKPCLKPAYRMKGGEESGEKQPMTLANLPTRSHL
jgi:hypothetical protein